MEPWTRSRRDSSFICKDLSGTESPPDKDESRAAALSSSGLGSGVSISPERGAESTLNRSETWAGMIWRTTWCGDYGFSPGEN